MGQPQFVERKGGPARPLTALRFLRYAFSRCRFAAKPSSTLETRFAMYTANIFVSLPQARDCANQTNAELQPAGFIHPGCRLSLGIQPVVNEDKNCSGSNGRFLSKCSYAIIGEFQRFAQRQVRRQQFVIFFVYNSSPVNNQVPSDF